jgi:hypothetical protein
MARSTRLRSRAPHSAPFRSLRPRSSHHSRRPPDRCRRRRPRRGHGSRRRRRSRRANVDWVAVWCLDRHRRVFLEHLTARVAGVVYAVDGGAQRERAKSGTRHAGRPHGRGQGPEHAVLALAPAPRVVAGLSADITGHDSIARIAFDAALALAAGFADFGARYRSGTARPPDARGGCSLFTARAGARDQRHAKHELGTHSRAKRVLHGATRYGVFPEDLRASREKHRSEGRGHRPQPAAPRNPGLLLGLVIGSGRGGAARAQAFGRARTVG